MGPYYTGRIVLNNIQVEGNYGNVNITPLPYAGENKIALRLTTTLPLVMFSSWTKFDTARIGWQRNPGGT